MSKAVRHKTGWIARVVIWSLAAAAAFAQETAERRPEGLSVQSVSGFWSYFSQGFPAGIQAPRDTEVGADNSVGSSGTLLWERTRHKSFFALRHRSSFAARFRHPVKGGNHDASMVMNRSLGTKWNWGNTAAVTLLNFDDALLNGTQLGTLASTPADFDDLASAVLKGKSNNPDLTGAALRPDTSIGRLLYGQRTASLGWQSNLSYARSSRLKIDFNGSAFQLRQLPNEALPVDFAFPRNLVIGGGADIGYSLTPRTQLGGEMHFIRTLSNVANSQAYLGTVSLGRTMGRRWFLQSKIGTGSTTTEGHRQHHLIGSAGIGVKTFSHTFLYTYDRSVDDTFFNAIGATSLRTAMNAAWSWNRPGRSWWMRADYSYVLAIATGVPTTHSWYTAAAVGRKLSRDLALISQYTIARVGSRRYVQEGRQYRLAQTAVRISLVWYPHFRIL